MELLEGRLTVDNLDSFVARLGEIGDARGVTIQAFDARYVAGRCHLERSVTLADRAIDRSENVARDRAVEILLYAAGRRQIDRALEMGVSTGANEAVLLVDGGERSGGSRSSSESGSDVGEPSDASDRDSEGGDETGALEDLERELEIEPESTLEKQDEERLCAFFEITDAERGATDADLADLVCERVALLEVEK